MAERKLSKVKRQKAPVKKKKHSPKKSSVREETEQIETPVKKIKNDTKSKQKLPKYIKENDDEQDVHEEGIDQDNENNEDAVDHDVEADENENAGTNEKDGDDNGDNEPNQENENEQPEKPEGKIADEHKVFLKNKIVAWMNKDDQIKEYGAKIKVLKQKKKKEEEYILNLIDRLGVGNSKIDVKDTKNGQLRGRVYKRTSTTKGPIKEDIIKSALMEVIHNERTVTQLVKKIDGKRKVTERHYLKRTKGNA